jgi:predicted DNA-binding transcriptional regulator AlpA
MLSEQYVTASELAERLGVAMTHLYWLVRCGKIPPGERMGQQRFYSRPQADAIAAWYGHYRAARDGMAWKQDGHGVAPSM